MSDKDWGSDTLARFRYQAEITLPYCLSVLLSKNDITAVIPEHIEDIALRTTTGWRFIQVKSRNPERGLWKATDLFVKGGGALRSLYRTYLLTADKDYPLELTLEGAVKTNDVIRKLRPNQDRSDLKSMVMSKLKASESQAEGFLRRVILNESAPGRSEIHATNSRLLHAYAPSLTQPELESLHDSLLEEIEKAMRCESIGALWPRSVVHPNARSDSTEERLGMKTLDADRLRTIGKRLSIESKPLLRRFVESGSRPISPLIQKLIVGGAPTDLIDRARNLKANAQHHRLVRALQSPSMNDELLVDVHERLLTYAQTAAAIHSRSDLPAIEMWSYLLDKCESSSERIDQNNLFEADPMLLMGESCVLSDMCKFNWGEAGNDAE